MLSTRVKKLCVKSSFAAVHLCIDIGNTRAKCALFENNTLTSLTLFSLPRQKTAYNTFVKKHFSQPHNSVIISDVTSRGMSHLAFIVDKKKQTLLLPELKLPFKIKYKEPGTLGADRVALACGAITEYPGKSILIISAGTCITYDILSKNQYLGGAIAPGLQMRLKAMHDNTAKLPLINKIPDNIPLTGQTTLESMLSGAILGALAEIAHTTELYNNIYPGLNVIITGGDAPYLQTRLKSKIFAQPNLALIGLNTILKLNAKNLNSA